MKNSDALVILNNAGILKPLKGFELSKTIVLNLKKIEAELIEPTKSYIEDKDNKEELIKEILDKPCDIEFIKVTEQMLPEDITVEQFSLLSNWM